MAMTDTRPRMTVREIALMREIVKWRKVGDITPARLGRMPCYRYPDHRAVVLTWWDDSVTVTTDYWHEPYSRHRVRSFTEAVDLLVALGYLPARFSTAYAEGWYSALGPVFGGPANAQDPVIQR
jgi:hypothetical protein